MGMSRLRWILALAVAAVALVATLQAARTYLAHHLNVGLLAVVGLAVTLVVGLVSLALARRRIGGELAALQGSPPGGSLLAARRQRLQTIKAAGVRPDRDALADATAAQEAGGAYIGRYLVATTVLMGLVGTFAGLMETLGKVAPLLTRKDADVLTLLGAPLGGLHVTFGASLVAILATLALALAQGDLALHEQRTLALLEDRTTHELVPALWPPAEEPAERTARALVDLRSDMSALLADALTGSLEQSARRMADSARSEGERAARALEATAASVEKQISKLSSAVAAAISEGTSKQSAALTEATSKHSAALAEATSKQSAALAEVTSKQSAALAEATKRQSAALVEGTSKQTAALTEATVGVLREAARHDEEAARRSATIADEVVRATSSELGRALAPMFAEEASRLEAVRAALAASATSMEAVAARLDGSGAQIEALARSQTDSVQATAQAILAGLDRTVLSSAGALDGAAGQLARAGGDLRAATELLAPRLETLSRELEAVGREVALLAARGADGELGAVVLGELERLGAGFDRLSDLVRLAGGPPPEDELGPLPIVNGDAAEAPAGEELAAQEESAESAGEQRRPSSEEGAS
jgi:hypothetical protein